jgi:hypothetical protein
MSISVVVYGMGSGVGVASWLTAAAPWIGCNAIGNWQLQWLVKQAEEAVAVGFR